MSKLYCDAQAYMDRRAMIARRKESYKRTVRVKKYSEKLVARTLLEVIHKFSDGRRACITKMHPLTDAGIPDYLVHVHPAAARLEGKGSGSTFYVECKTTGEQCTPLQIEKQARLHLCGVETFVLDTKIDDYWDFWTVVYQTYPTGKYYHRNPHIKKDD